MGEGVEEVCAAGTERTRVNGHEGNVLGRRRRRLLCGELRIGGLYEGGLLGGSEGLSGCSILGGRFEVAENGDVNVLVETGIRLETGFGFGTTFDYMEIMMEETESPFNAVSGVVVFDGMSELLCGFDELAVSYAGSRPGLGEMVCIELVKTAETRYTADDDVLAVFFAFLVGIHDAAVVIDAVNGV